MLDHSHDWRGFRLLANDIQNILGHSDANVTAKVYAHLVPGFLETAVNRLPIGKRSTPKAAPTPHMAQRFGQPVVSNRVNSPKGEGPAPRKSFEETGPSVWYDRLPVA